MPEDIFVSYSRHDSEVVSDLADRLRRLGTTVWIDQYGISAATRWSAEIVRALEGCRLVLLMVSERSLASTYVRQEVLLAAESGKAVLPLYLEPVRLPPEFRLHLAGIQNLDLTLLGPEGAAREVVRALQRVHLGDPPDHFSEGTSFGGHGYPGLERAVPRGTVTIVFTDIEGSSDLWEAQRQEMMPVFERHNEVVRELIASHNGVEVKTTGDGFMLAFDRAADAVRFACAIQSRLDREDWRALTPGVKAVKVRAGMHSGEVIVAEEAGALDYHGPVPNRAARVCGAALGGQVVVSQATWILAAPELGDLHWWDLGAHALKGIGEERLWLVSNDSTEPDLRKARAGASRRSKLPKVGTSFVGRQNELDRCTERIRSRSARVFSLIGPGGVGKSRLALQLAEQLVVDFTDGVQWVDLVEAVDAEGMRQRIAAALGLEPSSQQSLEEQIAWHLREKDLLLVLDNTEQIQENGQDRCGTVLKEIVDSTQRVVLLISTRRAPTVAAQQRIEVGALDQADAVSLFIERASAVRDDFSREGANERSVSDLCARLEYIPLAIELAAARVDTLSPREIERRLQSGFALLRSHDEDVPERFRTLETTIAWSYNLLNSELRDVFQKLAVFAGGFTLEAVEAVCGQQIALDGLSNLHRHSLVNRHMDESGDLTRFRLLETVREFAAAQLSRNSESAAAAHERQAAYFLTFGEKCAEGINTEREAESLAHLVSEFDNLQAAQRWAERAGDFETCARLALVIHQVGYWPTFWKDAAKSLELGLEAAARSPSRSAKLRAGLLFARAGLHRETGQYSQARTDAEESLSLQRGNGDWESLKKALVLLCAIDIAREDLVAALQSLDELDTMVDGTDHFWRGISFHNRACVASIQGNLDLAFDLNRKALRERRCGGLTRGVAESLCSHGVLAFKKGDNSEAAQHYRESLRLRSDLGDQLGIAILLYNLAEVAEAESALPAAVALYREAERRFKELQSVYAATAREALERLEDARSYEEWRTLLADSEAQSWEAWLASLE